MIYLKPYSIYLRGTVSSVGRWWTDAPSDTERPWELSGTEAEGFDDADGRFLVVGANAKLVVQACFCIPFPTFTYTESPKVACKNAQAP